jgi:hypothetical protein
MSFSKLISKPNLTLAWRRIATTKDARYKSYFRHIMEAYELSSDENIADLFRRLKNKEYSPQTPLRIYYPKASGLQRPITLLCIEDQIVLQAIANLFAEKVRARRQVLIGKSIYSNWLTKNNDSDFFLNDWKYGYYELRKALIGWYRQGYSWMANFDLAAFYDTIPHELLLKTIAPHGGKFDLTEFISNCLITWSADSRSVQHNHGIPQGPNASAFLAECVMLPIDEKMHRTCVYLRYVDDIRILGISELEVRKALVELDVLCRERGLIPSSEKTSIFKIKDDIQLVENIPPIMLYQEATGPKEILPEPAEVAIQEALYQNGNIPEIIDKSRFRYILFRSGASDVILRIVINLWSHNPHQVDAFASFLDNYARVDEIIDLCTRDIVSSPYDFIRGEAWKLLARMCTKDECRRLTTTAIIAVKTKNCSATRIGAYIFLLRCEELGLGLFSKWMMYEDSALIQAISIQNLLLRPNYGTELATQILLRHLPDPSLGLMKSLFNSQMSIDQFGLQPNTLVQVTRNVYFKAGIIQDGRRRRGDVIGNKLSGRYKILKWDKWHVIFGDEYQHAYSLLNLAESYYKGHRSAWLAQQDAFNDALFRAFQKILASKTVPGAISTTDRSGRLIDYGSLLTDATFGSAYPLLADHLNAIHQRRSRLPNAHPYEKRTGKKAIALKTNEQREMAAHCATAYSEIIRIATVLGI